MTMQQTLVKRAASDRGAADFGWLKSAHSFSFGNYHNPEHMQFGILRVINVDTVAGGAGFPSHPHRDAEIFSYVLQGALQHKDSMGYKSTVSEGGLQYMSAGSGVNHSEFNPSRSDPSRFLQVWLLPDTQGGEPRYETLDISPSEKQGKLKMFVSHDGRADYIRTLAKANVYAATIDKNEIIQHDLGATPKAWLQVARGSLTINGERARIGDGIAIEGGGKLVMDNGVDAEILLFELEEAK